MRRRCTAPRREAVILPSLMGAMLATAFPHNAAALAPVLAILRLAQVCKAMVWAPT